MGLDIMVQDAEVGLDGDEEGVGARLNKTKKETDGYKNLQVKTRARGRGGKDDRGEGEREDVIGPTMTDVNVSPNQIDVIIEIVVSLKGTGVKYLNRLAQQRSDDTTRHSYPCCCRR